jgi:Protein of unknown function (DUF4236)
MAGFIEFRFRRSLSIIPGFRVNAWVGKTGAAASVRVRGAHLTIGRRGIFVRLGVGVSSRRRWLVRWASWMGRSSLTQLTRLNLASLHTLGSAPNLNILKPWVILVPCAAFLTGFLFVGIAISHNRANGNGLLFIPILLALASLIFCIWLSRSGYGRKDAMRAATALLASAEPIVRAWFRACERMKTVIALPLQAHAHKGGPATEAVPASEPLKMEASLEQPRPSKTPPPRETPAPQPPTLEQLNAMLNEKIRKYNQELEEAEKRRTAEAERSARMNHLRTIMGRKTVMYCLDEEVQGPVTLLALIDKAQKGIVPIDTKLSFEGTSEWTRLNEI